MLLPKVPLLIKVHPHKLHLWQEKLAAVSKNPEDLAEDLLHEDVHYPKVREDVVHPQGEALQ